MGFFDNVKVKGSVNMKKVLRERFRNFVLDLKVRGSSEKTIDSYLYYNGKFLDFIRKEQRSITSMDIRSYLNYLVIEGVQPRTMNMAISSLKAYYEGYLGKKLFKNIRRSKIPKDMPNILSKEEILAMISKTKFLKHRLLIELLYSSGMRVGECIRIRIRDIDINNRLIFVKKGKGRKDRFTIASGTFINDLKKYLADISGEYLFDNGSGGHITARTAETIVRDAATKAGIRKNVYPHLLRACFATHLLENGTSLEKVQKLLGHSRIQTTMSYIRTKTDDLRQIKSPLD